MLVLDEGEAHEAFAVGTETDPGTHRHLGLLDEVDGEIQRPHLFVRVRDRRPDEHRAFGLLDLPSGSIEAVDERVPATEIDLVDLVYVIVALVERDDRRDLDGLEGAVVEVGLEFGERSNDLGVPDGEADPPTGHRMTFRERVELDAHLLGARHLKHRRRCVVVERDVGVCEIVNQDHLVLLGKCDETLEELEIDAHRRGVVREGHDDHPGPRPRIPEHPLENLEIVVLGVDRCPPHLCSRQRRGIDVDRIRRLRDDCRIAGLHQRPHQVGQALLGSDGGDDLGVGVEGDTESALVTVGDCLAEIGQTPGDRVPVILLETGSLHQFVHDKGCRGDVGIPEAEIDDIGSCAPSCDLALVHLGEHVRREVVDSSEFHHRNRRRTTPMRGGVPDHACGVEVGEERGPISSRRACRSVA